MNGDVDVRWGMLAALFGGTIPKTDKNVYNENNLAQVKITYYGYDLTNSNHAYVSNTERQDTYIYFNKFYNI